MGKNICTGIFLLLITFTYGQNSGIICFVNDTTFQNIQYSDTADFRKKIVQKLNTYRQTGHINASIDSVNTPGHKCSAIIYKGEQYVWDTLILQLPRDNRMQFPDFNYNKNKPVNLISLIKYRSSLVQMAENNGYPFAQVHSNFHTHTNRLHLTLTLKTGESYKVDTLVFNRNIVSRKYLQQYLNLQPGTAYNEKNIQKIRRKINQLDFIGLSGEPVVRFGNQLARPELKLEKRQANAFNGLVGIVPDNNRKNKYILTGDINLSLVNMLNRGEQINLQWKKNDRFSQQLDASLRWPFLFNTPFGVDGQIEMLKQDTAFVNLQWRTGLFIYFAGNNSATGYYKNKQTIVLSPVDTNNITTSNTYGSGIEFLFRQTDNNLNPAKGYRILTDIGAGRRNIVPPGNSNKIKAGYFEASAKIEGFVPLYKNWILKLQSRFAGIYSDKKLYKNELIRLGGLKTLRGFDENFFFATYYNIATLEIRWLFESFSHFKLFTDAAYIHTLHHNQNITRWPVGIGAGLNLHTNAGIFSISYALGRYNRQTFQLNNAKIHFGYINNF